MTRTWPCHDVAEYLPPLSNRTNALLNNVRALRISSFSVIAPLAVGLALSGCVTGTTATQTPLASSEAQPPSAGISIGQRDLTPEEKKVIMDAVAPSLRNPGSAKYHWAKFPAVVTEGSVNYCATVDAQSPYAAYNGRQAYIAKYRRAATECRQPSLVSPLAARTSQSSPTCARNTASIRGTPVSRDTVRVQRSGSQRRRPNRNPAGLLCTADTTWTMSRDTTLGFSGTRRETLRYCFRENHSVPLFSTGANMPFPSLILARV